MLRSLIRNLEYRQRRSGQKYYRLIRINSERIRTINKPEEATGVEEKETQGIAIAHEIVELRSSARSEADYEVVLQKTRELRRLFAVGSESKLSGEVIEQVEEPER